MQDNHPSNLPNPYPNLNQEGSQYVNINSDSSRVLMTPQNQPNPNSIFLQNQVNPANQVNQAPQPVSQPQNVPVQNQENSCFNWLDSIPLGVFIIILWNLIINFFIALFGIYTLAYITTMALFNASFCLLVWAPIAKKVETSASTARYLSLYMLNSIILTFFGCGLCAPWQFNMFETLLITFVNMDKKMKFCCCKVGGKMMVFLVIFTNLWFNSINLWAFLFTIFYSYIYYKCLMKKFIIKNEQVEYMEKTCFFSCLRCFATFISLADVKKRQQNNNNNTQNVDTANPNASFVPSPVYFSQIPFPPNSVIQMQNIPSNNNNMSNNININSPVA